MDNNDETLHLVLWALQWYKKTSLSVPNLLKRNTEVGCVGQGDSAAKALESTEPSLHSTGVLLKAMDNPKPLQIPFSTQMSLFRQKDSSVPLHECHSNCWRPNKVNPPRRRLVPGDTLGKCPYSQKTASSMSPLSSKSCSLELLCFSLASYSVLHTIYAY